MQIKILLCALLLFTACAEEPQNMAYDMPEDIPEYEEPEYTEPEPYTESTPYSEPEQPKTDTTIQEENTVSEEIIVTKENRIINASIQNELKAKERLIISFPISELEAPEVWTTCKIIDAETEKALLTFTSTYLGMMSTISFQADNERHIAKSFVARIEFFNEEITTLLKSEEVTIYAPITQFWLGWQNREGKLDQGFVLLKSGEVKYLSTINDRTGASDCAMRLVLRIPEGETVVISKSIASIGSGETPMPTHYRLSDYNAKYRTLIYPAPDDPLYHYDTDNSKWITDKSITLEGGFHVVHVVPDNENFDDTELVVTVEHGSNMYGVSNYYIPENIALLKSLAVSE